MDIDSNTVTSKLQITQIMWVSVRGRCRLKIIGTLSLVEHGGSCMVGFALCNYLCINEFWNTYDDNDDEKMF